MTEQVSGMVGFGFGPIQAGLFCQAFRRHYAEEIITVVDIQDQLVEQLQVNAAFSCNVANTEGCKKNTCTNVQAYNSRTPSHRQCLIEALLIARVVSTALPSTACYDGDETSPAALIAEACKQRLTPLIILLGENHHDAAGVLRHALSKRGVQHDAVVCINTVIGKMSGIRPAEKGLIPIYPSSKKAFLVEAGDHCFCQSGSSFYPEWQIGDDLTPFNALKLYGHNAAHFALALLAAHYGGGAACMAEIDSALLADLRTLMISSIGPALRAEYPIAHHLFTEEGFITYTDDLIARMVAPALDDEISRIIRDLPRKLAWNDRLIGAIRLLHKHNKPADFLYSALRKAIAYTNEDPITFLYSCWQNDIDVQGDDAQLIIRVLQ